MAKSLFNFYLQKVSEGDSAYVDKLCSRLADRLIFVPVLKTEGAGSGKPGSTKVNVVRISEEHRTLVPVFSSAKLLKDWSSHHSHDGEFISLLGADFCAALGKESWLVVDPADGIATELQPFLVEKIAKFDFVTEQDDDAEHEAAHSPEPITQKAAASDRFDYQPSGMSPSPEPSPQILRTGRTIQPKTAVAEKPKAGPAPLSPPPKLQEPPPLQSQEKGQKNSRMPFQSAPKAAQQVELPGDEDVASTVASFAGGAIFGGAAPLAEHEGPKDEGDGSKKKKSFLSFLKFGK